MRVRSALQPTNNTNTNTNIHPQEVFMKLTKLALLTTLLGTGTSAFADGGGSMTIQGKEFALKSAYAYSCPDPFDKSKQSTEIAFSGRVLDTKQIESLDNASGALSAALNQYFPDKEARPTQVTIILARGNTEAPIQNISYSIPNLSSGASVGAAYYTLDLKRHDDKRIEGTLRSKNKSDKTSRFGGYFDLHFALDVRANIDC